MARGFELHHAQNTKAAGLKPRRLVVISMSRLKTLWLAGTVPVLRALFRTHMVTARIEELD